MPAIREQSPDPLPGPRGAARDDAEILVVEGLTKRWPRLERPVLDAVSLTVRAGSRTRIVGANGAGKTTLIRVIAGLVLPEAGTVRVEGHDPVRDREAVQRRVGFLSAGDRGLYARLTVRQHLDLWSRLALLPAARRRAAVERSMADFALHDLEGARTDRMSMGQRQRLRVAMAFLHEPRLTLLDEPMNSLDDAAADLLAAAIARTAQVGGACLWISPGDDRASVDFDATLVLAGGRLEPR
ncbi:ABC transporter ATP-binding protein [Baekduia soli]|uniref:ABC transporter ATP-binding protein n=1 Tax=Baekduia soli TaxID=496014 RepID=A0A5B8U106_9ACTN|nr:ABC transporter ATP-binding protein [Baekduia soli]QEC46676.1 ABC transporter ATP-binding protein [Baekduia soli]